MTHPDQPFDRHRRNALALAALAAAPLVLRAQPTQAQGASELRLGMSGDITTMDPHWLNTGPNNAVARHIFDLLIDVDARGRLVPGLAESWKLVEPTLWELKLRRGVKWHDGTEFTADDALFSIERPKLLTVTPSGYASFLKTIESVTAPDPVTVRIRVTVPNNAWFQDDLSNISVVQRRACEKASTQSDFDSGKATIGTGAYRFVRFARGDRIELVRNADYWGGSAKLQPQFERVTLRMLIANAPRVAALLAGDVDAIENVPVQDLGNVKAAPQFRVVEPVSWRTLFFHMDQWRDDSPFITDKSGKPLGKNPFKDARVRTAFDKAINRQALSERVMEGLGKPSANLLSPGVFGHNPDLKPEAYDPEGAKALLAQAGYPSGFALVVHGPNNRYINDEQVIQTVAGMLSRIGIAVRVETMPTANYFPRANKSEFSFNMVGWGSLSGDSSMRHQFATPNEQEGWGAWNNGRGSYPELDALLRKSRASADNGQREAIAKDAATLIRANHQAIFLYHQVVTWAMRKNLTFAGRVDEMMLAHLFARV